ncbi:hypothetical protein CK503_13570 [Aliifodinibius salipaludis]|uniref:Uncharacterized protein n=1 Tax=Fodinibius salipaludis TaxID=2032627 RepID=A0A2A2G8M8_9BACT|nr:hypothetical protein CK503_13570 [Aliifodinibius salipaludis]
MNEQKSKKKLTGGIVDFVLDKSVSSHIALNSSKLLHPSRDFPKPPVEQNRKVHIPLEGYLGIRILKWRPAG